MQRRMSSSAPCQPQTRVVCTAYPKDVVHVPNPTAAAATTPPPRHTLASAKVSSDLVVTNVLEAASATMVGVREEAAAPARVEVTTAGAMKAELGSAERRHAAVAAASVIARPPEKSILLCCWTRVMGNKIELDSAETQRVRQRARERSQN